jgi:hypothetical protein
MLNAFICVGYLAAEITSSTNHVARQYTDSQTNQHILLLSPKVSFVILASLISFKDNFRGTLAPITAISAVGRSKIHIGTNVFEFITS